LSITFFKNDISIIRKVYFKNKNLENLEFTWEKISIKFKQYEN